MRICHILSTPIPPVEGIGFYVWNLSKYLNNKGHEVHIITRGQAKRTPHQNLNGITIWYPPFLPVYPLHVHFHNFYVNSLISQLELDLLHLHMPLVKFPESRIPTFVTFHSLMKADVSSIPINSYFGILTRLQLPISIHLEKEILYQVDKIAVVANSVTSELKAYGIDPDSIKVMGNGVDTNIFFPLGDELPLSRDTYFLTVGRLGPRKGLEDLIRCASSVVKHFPDIRFYIAGSGPFEGKLRKEVKRLELTRQIIFLGHVSSRAQLVDLYRGATAYIHPAHYEGLPTVLLEAMACARPVIATAVSGALDVVEDGFNGLLVPPRTPQKMAQAIVRLLEDPQLGEQLGAAAWTTIQDMYSWQVVGNNYLDQYHNLVGNSH